MTEKINSSLKTAVKGTALVLSGSVAGLILMFLTRVIIVRNFTKEEFGYYSLAVAVVTFISTVVGTGFLEGGTRYVSMFSGQSKEREARDAARSTLLIGTLLGLLFTLLLAMFAEPIAGHLFYKPELASILRIISFYCFFSILLTVVIGVLRGYGLIWPQFLQVVGIPILFLAMLGVGLFFGLSLSGLVVIHLLSTALITIVLWAYGRKKYFLRIGRGGHEMEITRFALPLVTGGLTSMLANWFDTLMLGRYMGAETVGIYNVGMTLARFLTFPLSAVWFIFVPIAAELYSRKDMGTLERTYQVLTKWVLSVTFPFFFILFFFPEMVLIFIFGSGFTEAATALRILSLGFLFSAFFGSNGVILVVQGMSKIIMYANAMTAIVNITLNYVLIKRLGLGMTGASVSTMATYAFAGILTASILYRHNRIHPLTANYLKPLAGTSLTALLVYILAKSLPLYTWMFPLYFALFMVGSMSSLLLTRSLDREDLFLFEAILKKTGLEMRFLKKILRRFAAVEN